MSSSRSDLGITPEEVLHFWFTGNCHDGVTTFECLKIWWGKQPAIDAYISDHFEPLIKQGMAGELRDWETTPEGTFALIILYDQMSRNAYRGTAGMFSQDQEALRLAKSAIEQGWDVQFPTQKRMFFYMPLMHAEDMADQDFGVKKFSELAAEDSSKTQFIDYMNRHRAIIERFGRYPHRNKILNRNSTPEEEEFLLQPGSSFL